MSSLRSFFRKHKDDSPIDGQRTLSRDSSHHKGPLFDEPLETRPSTPETPPETPGEVGLREMADMTVPQLVHLILSSPVAPGSTNVRLLTSRYVVRYVPYQVFHIEAEFHQAFRTAEKLGMKFPRVRKVIQRNNGSAYLIMDRIHGKSLEEIWNDLSWAQSVAIARKLRVVIRKMKNATRDYGGSIYGGACRTHFLREAGTLWRPHCVKFMEIIYFWKVYGTKFKDTGVEGRKYGFQRVKYFVLTYQNLMPSHIMVDEEGDLVFVNWLKSGYYPKFFEGAAMYHWAEIEPERPRPSWSQEAHLRWKWMCRWAVGYDSYEAELLMEIRKKIKEAPSRGNREDFLTAL